MKNWLTYVKKFLDIHFPEYQKLRVVHVAGTNGKWSTVQMIHAWLEASWYRVGVFMSPHLLDVRERVVCNGELISQADFDRTLWSIFKASEHVFSFFEMIVLVSVIHFLEQQPDYVIYEVWLWGTYDATNIRTTPVATVITPIWYDHQHILGNSLSQIQRNKMGIMKKNIPCFTRIDTPLMRWWAKCKWAVLHIVSTLADTNLNGDYQRENAGVAAEVLRYIWCDEENIILGLQQVSHLWRCQYLRENVLIDCAHNEQWRRVLAEYVDSVRIKYDKVCVVFGTTKKKEYLELWNDMLVRWDTTYLVKPSVNRWVEPWLYKDLFSTVEILDLEDLIWVVSSQSESTLWVVYGSLYLVADVLWMDW